MTASSQELSVVLQHFEEGLKFETKRVLISTSPKNQAAPIEMVISDFFRISQTFIAFDSLCHKSLIAKGKP